MQGRKHEVARFGGLQGDFGRFQITHLTDQYNFWRLPQCGSKRRSEIFGVSTNFTLVDRAFLVIMEKLDRVLDSYDMVSLRVVDLIDDRRERRTLTGTCRAR